MRGRPKLRVGALGLVLVGLGGCGTGAVGGADGDPDGTDASGPGGSSSAPTTSADSTTTSGPTSSGTASTSGTTQPLPTDSDDDTTFGDGGDVARQECDPWLQDCPEGNKCIAYANDGTDVWNDHICRPVHPAPAQPGEPCAVAGGPATGVDTCAFGSMCWVVDPETLEGTCVEQCGGTVEEPTCSDLDTSCYVSEDEILALCLPNCSPLLQDCPPGTACYGLEEGLGVFLCLPEGGQELGEPCGGLGECVAGTQCTAPERVPGCAGPDGCCSSWCDLSEPFTEETCLPDQECIPFYEDFWFDEVGLCGTPVR